MDLPSPRAHSDDLPASSAATSDGGGDLEAQGGVPGQAAHAAAHEQETTKKAKKVRGGTIQAVEGAGRVLAVAVRILQTTGVGVRARGAAGGGRGGDARG